MKSAASPSPANLVVGMFAVLCCVLAPIPGLGYSMTLGAPLGILTLVSTYRWLGSRLHRGLLVLVLLTVLLAPMVSLISLSVAPDRMFEPRDFVKEMVTFVSLAGVASGVAFGCRTLGILPAAALVGGSATLNQLLRPEVSDDTLWKFRLAWTVPVLVLAVLGRAPRLVQAAAVAGLAGVAVWYASRNNLAALGTAGVVTLIAMLLARRGRASGGVGRGRIALAGGLAIGLPALAVTVLPTWFAAGEFGQAIQRRTVNQLDAAGFLGGRYEYGASWALFQHDPWGYGPGVIASTADITRAGHGLRLIGVDFDSGGYTEEYVLHQLLADNFRLHSVAAEFWLRGGPLALVLAAVVALVLVRGLIAALTRRELAGTALLGFCCMQSLWDVLFSPVRPNGVWIFVTVGLCFAVAMKLATVTESEPIPRRAQQTVLQRSGVHDG